MTFQPHCHLINYRQIIIDQLYYCVLLMSLLLQVIGFNIVGTLTQHLFSIGSHFPRTFRMWSLYLFRYRYPIGLSSFHFEKSFQNGSRFKLNIVRVPFLFLSTQTQTHPQHTALEIKGFLHNAGTPIISDMKAIVRLLTKPSVTNQVNSCDQGNYWSCTGIKRDVTLCLLLLLMSRALRKYTVLHATELHNCGIS